MAVFRGIHRSLVDSPCRASNVKLWYFRWSLQWRHNGSDNVSNHQPHDCLLNRLFRRRSKKTSKLRVTGLCARNSPGTGEFLAQMASNAENVSIWWRHQDVSLNRLLKKQSNQMPCNIAWHFVSHIVYVIHIPGHWFMLQWYINWKSNAGEIKISKRCHRNHYNSNWMNKFH